MGDGWDASRRPSCAMMAVPCGTLPVCRKHYTRERAVGGAPSSPRTGGIRSPDSCLCLSGGQLWVAGCCREAYIWAWRWPAATAAGPVSHGVTRSVLPSRSLPPPASHPRTRAVTARPLAVTSHSTTHMHTSCVVWRTRICRAGFSLTMSGHFSRPPFPRPPFSKPPFGSLGLLLFRPAFI